MASTTLTVSGRTLRLVETCGACPEQYDVFDGDRLIGYLRLRWSHFTASYPNVEGVDVYAVDIDDEGYTGQFDTEDQRRAELIRACEALVAADLIAEACSGLD